MTVGSASVIHGGSGYCCMIWFGSYFRLDVFLLVVAHLEINHFYLVQNIRRFHYATTISARCSLRKLIFPEKVDFPLRMLIFSFCRRLRVVLHDVAPAFAGDSCVFFLQLLVSARVRHRADQTRFPIFHARCYCVAASAGW